MEDSDIDFDRNLTGSSSSSSDEDFSELANFDDIYQDILEEEYGLEQIDGLHQLSYNEPPNEFEAEEIIITESDISASQEYEHLNSHLYDLQQENCSLSN